VTLLDVRFMGDPRIDALVLFRTHSTRTLAKKGEIR
jgi:hypothetical protein